MNVLSPLPLFFQTFDLLDTGGGGGGGGRVNEVRRRAEQATVEISTGTNSHTLQVHTGGEGWGRRRRILMKTL